MGTLQSFTPLPQTKVTIFLFKPSNILQSSINSGDFKQIYNVNVQIFDKFPVQQLIQGCNSQNKIKILVEQEKLVQINHFVLIFHHKIVIVLNDNSQSTKELKQQQQKQLQKNTKQKISQQFKKYTPHQLQFLKHCKTINMKQLVQQIKNKQFKKKQQMQKNQIVTINLSQKSLSSAKDIPTFNSEYLKKLQQKIKISNYKRRSTIQGNGQRKRSKKLQITIDGNNLLKNSLNKQNNVSVVNDVLCHYNCPFMPISILLFHLNSKIIRKTLNLFQFYQINFIRYPSLEIFLAAQCNSVQIICGPNQLQQLSRKVQSQHYPFSFNNPLLNLQKLSNPSKSIISSNIIKNSQSQFNIYDSQNYLLSQQDITFYCFCNQSFAHQFKNNRPKIIGILKDKLIEVKFFKNILQLCKQVIKDQKNQNQKDLYTELMKQKMSSISIKKLKSPKEGLDNQDYNLQEKQNIGDKQKSDQNQIYHEKEIKQHSNNKFGLLNRKNQTTSALYKSFRFNNNNIKHNNLSVSLNKTLGTIPRISISQPHQGISSKNYSTSLLPKSIEDRFPNSLFSSTIYFVLHQKQKDRYSIQSLAKKLTRHLKNIKVKKITEIQYLVQRIKHNCISIVIINDNIKILQQFYLTLEIHSIQDKVIIIKREQGETYQSLLNKINDTRECGFAKIEKYFSFSYLNKSVIVMGSKNFLKHIFMKYPFIQVKQFIDITIYKQHRKIRQIISRKNQIIVSNVAICDICNLEYKGLIKAKIVYYQSNAQNNKVLISSGRGDCHCSKYKISSQNLHFANLSLDKMLQNIPIITTKYPYVNKKLSYFSSQISALLGKIKQKKMLANAFQQKQSQKQTSEILFFCADSWIIQQMSSIIKKMFNSRYSSIYLSQWMLQKIIYKCIKQVQTGLKILVQSQIILYKNQNTTKNNQIIQKSKQIYTKLQQNLSKAKNIFQISQFILQFFIINTLFRNCINYLWKNILSLNKNQYPLNCSTLFFVFFLGFRKGGTMKRNDSINDGSFKSFKNLNCKHRLKIQKNEIKENQKASNYFNTNHKNKANTNCSLVSYINHNSTFQAFDVIQNDNNLRKQHEAQIQNTKRQQKSTNENNAINDQIGQDQIIQNSSCQTQNLHSKVYLKLSNYQKPDEVQSLRKFFISKNNVFSYIYTTQFLVFELIHEEEIEETVLLNLNTKQNRSHIKDEIIKNMAKQSPKSTIKHLKNVYMNENNYTQLSKNNQISQIQNTNKKVFQCKQDKNQDKNKFVEKALFSLSPLIASLISSNKQDKKPKQSLPIQQQLQLKSCKNIELLSSTEDSLIICVQNMELLNYNLFIPFYRSNFGLIGEQQKKCKKYFILAPFTKLQINNNYTGLNQCQSINSGTSLITHQLKLSLDHQQRFLQKILSAFLIDKSNYYDKIDQMQNQIKQNQFEVDSSKLFNFKDGDFNYGPENQEKRKIEEEQLIILKSSNKRQTREKQNPWNTVKLMDQKFQLPFTDQFFILMNQCKYFSAHYLLINHLPKNNMTNAYHSILLTRKGLYQQALNILLPSNPFRKTIQLYVQELKNRIYENKQLGKQFSKVEKKVEKTQKWKLSYVKSQQKFQIISKTDPQKSFCYNDDSLGIVYKKVLISQQDNYLKRLKNITPNKDGNNNKGVLHSLPSSQINSKSLNRRLQKQSSIAIHNNNPLRQNTSIDSKQIANFGDGESIINRKSGFNTSLKSRDSVLKDMLQNVTDSIKQQPVNKRYGVVRYSSFSMLGNGQNNKFLGINSPQIQNKQINNLSKQKRQSRFIDLKELIQQKPSSSASSEGNSSTSQQKNKLDQIMQQTNMVQTANFRTDVGRKISTINVKTRKRSNFFLDRFQQLQKQGNALLKSPIKQIQLKKNKSSNPSNQQIKLNKRSKGQISQYKIRSTQSVLINKCQYVDNSQQIFFKSQPNQVINQPSKFKQKQHEKYQKGSTQMFKTFESEKDQIKNQSWASQKQQQKFFIIDQIKKEIQVVLESESNNQFKDNQVFQNSFDKRLENNDDTEIDKKQKCQVKLINQGIQETKRSNFQSQIRKNFQKTIKFQPIQQNLKQDDPKQMKCQHKNQLKTLFTLDLSQSSSQQQIQISIKTQKQNDLNKSQIQKHTQLNVQKDNDFKQEKHNLTNSEQKELCIKNVSFKQASPYKLFQKYLQQQLSQSFQSQLPAIQQVQQEKCKQTQSQINQNQKIIRNLRKSLKAKYQFKTKNNLKVDFNQNQNKQIVQDSKQILTEARQLLNQIEKSQKKSSDNILSKNQDGQQILQANAINKNQLLPDKNIVRDSLSQQNSQISQNNVRCTQDNQDFLKNHHHLYQWHNKKIMKSNNSKKNLKSIKQLASNYQINKNINSYENNNNNSNINNTGSILLLPTSKILIMPRNSNREINQPKLQDRESVRSDKNAFTFMRPSTGPQNRPIYVNDFQDGVQKDDQIQHIQEFHSRLMNNSSIFINEPSMSKYSNKQIQKKSKHQNNFFCNNNTYASDKYFFQQSQRQQGLKSPTNNEKQPQQKFSIIVKTMKIKKDNKESQKKIIRISAEDYIHEKQHHQSCKNSRMSQQPSQRRNDSLKQKRQSVDSWFNDQTVSQVNQQLKNEVCRKSSKENSNFRPPLQKNKKSKRQIQNQRQNKVLQNQRQSSERNKAFEFKKNKQQSSSIDSKQCLMQKQCKVYPQQLLYLSPNYYQHKKPVIKQKQISSKPSSYKQKDMQSSNYNPNSIQENLNYTMKSLKNLKLNCDIRRKR